MFGNWIEYYKRKEIVPVLKAVQECQKTHDFYLGRGHYFFFLKFPAPTLKKSHFCFLSASRFFCGYPGRVLCTQYSTGHSTQHFFCAKWGNTCEGIIVVQWWRVIWKEGKARHMIGENFAYNDEFVVFFFESAASNPKKTTFSLLCLSHSWWGQGGAAVQYLPN